MEMIWQQKKARNEWRRLHALTHRERLLELLTARRELCRALAPFAIGPLGDTAEISEALTRASAAGTLHQQRAVNTAFDRYARLLVVVQDDSGE